MTGTSEHYRQVSFRGHTLHMFDPGEPHPIKLSLAFTVGFPYRFRIQLRGEHDAHSASDVRTGQEIFDARFVVTTPKPDVVVELLDEHLRHVLLLKVQDTTLFIDERGLHLFVHRDDRTPDDVERELHLAFRELIDLLGAIEVDMASRNLTRPGERPLKPNLSFLPEPALDGAELPPPFDDLDDRAPFHAFLSTSHKGKKQWLHLELRQKNAKGWWRAGVSAPTRKLSSQHLETLPQLDRDFPKLSERKMQQVLARVRALMQVQGVEGW